MSDAYSDWLDRLKPGDDYGSPTKDGVQLQYLGKRTRAGGLQEACVRIKPSPEYPWRNTPEAWARELELAMLR